MEPHIKYPSVPLHALPPPKKRDTNTANGLTLWCLERLNEMHQVYAYRNSSEGKYRPGKEVTNVLGQKSVLKGTWLPGDNKGAADIIACYKGRFIAFEIKIGKDRQSAVQAAWQKRIEDSGGKYYIVKSTNDFYEAIKRIQEEG